MPRFPFYMYRHPNGDAGGGGAADKSDGDTDGGSKGFSALIGEGKKFATEEEFLADYEKKNSAVGKLGTEIGQLRESLNAEKQAREAAKREAEEQARRERAARDAEAASGSVKAQLDKDPIRVMAEVGTAASRQVLAPFAKKIATMEAMEGLPLIENRIGFAENRDKIVKMIKDNPDRFNSPESVIGAYAEVVVPDIDSIVEKRIAAERETVQKELAKKGIALTYMDSGGSAGGGSGAERQVQSQKETKPEDKAARRMKEIQGSAPRNPFDTKYRD